MVVFLSPQGRLKLQNVPDHPRLPQRRVQHAGRLQTPSQEMPSSVALAVLRFGVPGVGAFCSAPPGLVLASLSVSGPQHYR
ncbi:hypothetical protein E2C01_021119 [Portunus trituberculatus]|uniref:Uncharacterized protein n=1 Tax=Portunus trituberculatus TaxID=210409 RepID=A0A5B7E1W2_PORTR|nr:hypothetical protein [Portunus trituberculatus]